MLLVSVSRIDILRYGAKKWKLKDRQIDMYIERARREIEASAIINRDEQLGLALGRLNDLYAKNMQIDDYRAALQVQKELSGLLGLNAPMRHEIDWKTRAIKDIQAGRIEFQPFANAFDNDLAVELFKQAGVPVVVEDS